MNNISTFVDIFKGSKVPNVLTKEETIYYFNKLKQGDKTVRNLLIESNIKLVLHRIKKFKSLPYDIEDLVSCGLIGLIKAVDSYDVSRNVDFPTYAYRCIDNEILAYNEKNKKHNKNDSMENVISIVANGSKLTIADILCDNNINITSDYEKEELLSIIPELVESLPEREKEIIKLQFGFYNDKLYSQYEIADIFHLDQSYICRIIKKAIYTLSIELQNRQLMDLKTKSINTKYQKKIKY